MSAPSSEEPTQRGQERKCSPMEQGIAGFIVGPTDLCDR